MDTDARRLMRAVVRRVHPDLFAAHPYERQRNSESLKALNAYVDALAAAAGASRGGKGRRGGLVADEDGNASYAALPPRATTVEFWVRSSPSSLPGSAQSSFQEEEDAAQEQAQQPQQQQLTRVVASLPASGSLAPLFFAFGLITDAELRAGAGGLFGSSGGSSAADTDLLQWLRDTVAGAVSAAERHEKLKRRIREARASLEHRHALASLRAGAGDYAAGPGEQRRQLEALRALGAAMAALATDGARGSGRDEEQQQEQQEEPSSDGGGLFAGLSVHVHYVPSRGGGDEAEEEDETEDEEEMEEDDDEEEVAAAAADGDDEQRQQRQQRQRRRQRRRSEAVAAAEDEDEADEAAADAENAEDPFSTAHPPYIADDGCLHLFAAGPGPAARRASLRASLRALDLPRARALAEASMFWLRRVRELAPVVRSLLRVENVWCDTRTEQNAQNFVLWAGYLLEQREAAAEVLEAALLLGAERAAAAAAGNGGDGNNGAPFSPASSSSSSPAPRFNFSLLVHSDPDSPPISYSPASSILQVRSDCAPRHLAAFLVSEAGAAADAAAQRAASQRQEEQDLLERVRRAYGAKHVVRVCAARDPALVLDGARRLLGAADAVREAGVDLRGCSLALDDCYELWGSGFISIPYDFALSDLRPQLARLLQEASNSKGGAAAQEAAAAEVVGGGGGGGGVAAGAFGAPQRWWRRHSSSSAGAAAAAAPRAARCLLGGAGGRRAAGGVRGFGSAGASVAAAARLMRATAVAAGPRRGVAAAPAAPRPRLLF
jgi:hypothetical protein